MKLYSEEQVIKLTKAAFTAGKNCNPFIFSQELNSLTPIELPSDEEINIASKNNSAWEYNHETNFKLGARYVTDKIKGGNND